MRAFCRLLMLCWWTWICECDDQDVTNCCGELKVCSPYMGCVKGKHMPGYDTEKFEAFLGIPYALPPVNILRFSNPKAMPKFVGLYDATQVKSDCIQKNYLLPQFKVQGLEDCLYLNVYRPETSTSRGLLPVMVYIYGGGWFSGTASPLVHGPEYFMDTKEVILVTFNYRLGPMGFLSTNDSNMSGNFGLKDQNLALRWVQKNIFYFGGNPKMVTLFGQSAGAVSAHMHILSKHSEGLFHRFIAISGTANVPFAITEDPLAQTRKIAQFCNITNAENLSTIKLTRALRNVDADALLDAGDKLKYWDVDPLTNFRPVVENANIQDAFLTQHPMKIMAKGNFKPVPWMAGFVKNEGAVRAVAILENEELKSSFNHDFDILLENLLELPKKFNRTQINTIMSSIIDYYLKGERRLNGDNDFGLLDLISDRGFLRPLYNAIDTYVSTIQTSKYPVFLYKFDYKGANSYANIYTGGLPSRDYGVVHCDDLIYLFRSPMLFPDFPTNSTDAAAMRANVDNFVHFAKHGTPRNAELQRPCNMESLQGNNFCDYQEFTNTREDSFEIRIASSFQVDQVILWNNALAYSKQ